MMVQRLERLVRPGDRVGEPAPRWTLPFCLGCGQHGSHGAGCPTLSAGRPWWRRRRYAQR